jgi:hypothetical protein
MMQRVVMIARPSFSLKKGFLHAVAASAVFMLVGMIFAFTGAFGNQIDRVGEAAGQQLALAFLLAFVASYGFQTEKRALGWIMLGLVVLLLAYHINFFVRITHDIADNRPMTAAERELPAREGSRPRLCQSALGFSFPASDFAVPYEPERKPELPANVSQWQWMIPGTGKRILVQATQGVGRTEDGFRAFTAALKERLEYNNAMLGNGRVLWTDGRGEFSVSGMGPNGWDLRIRCVSHGPAGDRPPLTVCLQIINAGMVINDRNDLREVAEGLEAVPCLAAPGSSEVF